MKKLLPVLFITIVAGAIAQTNIIPVSVPFLTITPDARAAGMGEPGVATSPDANAAHWNAARLTTFESSRGIACSFTPWLRALYPDINLFYASAYFRPDKKSAIAASFRYYSMGESIQTAPSGAFINYYNPHEYAGDLSYAIKLNKRIATSLTIRYIYSDIAGNAGYPLSPLSPYSPAKAFASDIAFYSPGSYHGADSAYRVSWGVNISNLGDKVAFVKPYDRVGYLPMNLKAGTAVTRKINAGNSIALSLDLNKLLVPTPPQFDTVQGPSGSQSVIVKGKKFDRPVFSAIAGSFSDAPGGFHEELQEVAANIGAEYNYDDVLFVRGGYCYEDPYKGDRQYFTCGLGLKYKAFGLDLAYLIPSSQRSPYENTMRFSLSYTR